MGKGTVTIFIVCDILFPLQEKFMVGYPEWRCMPFNNAGNKLNKGFTPPLFFFDYPEGILELEKLVENIAEVGPLFS